MDNSQRWLAMLAGIFVLGIGTQWFAWSLRLPAILLLLAAGTLAGSVTGWIDPQALFGDTLLPMVSLSVGLILFEGGLNLRFRELRQIWKPLLGLLTVGLLVTWLGATLAAVGLLQMPVSIALILGAVLSVTGPTVVGPLLRDIRPAGRISAIAKWEGITIDPIGASLALLVFEAIDEVRAAELGTATQNALHGLAMVTLVGVVIGMAAAALLVVMLKRYWIPDYLQNSVTLMFVVTSFTAANLLHHEAGLLAVTVMGIALANQRQVDTHRILEFKESLSVVLIATLFILLSARVPLASLAQLGWRGPLFAMSLIVVVRPVAVWLSTIGSGLTLAERCFLSWLAPRGIVAAAVSSVFALRLGDAGAAIAPATFIVIFLTVATYGLTAGWLARRLGLSNPDAQGWLIAGANQTARAIAQVLVKEGILVTLVDTQFRRIRKARDSGLTAVYANILSEQVLDELDFGGLGQFLACTSNDEANTLAVARFRDLFGRDKVFQLSRAEARHARLENYWQLRLEGRTAFASDLTYSFIDDALDNGATIKVTALTEAFDYTAFHSHYGQRAWPMFVREEKQLRIVNVERPPAFRPGMSLISLVLPNEPRPSNNHGSIPSKDDSTSHTDAKNS